VSELVLGGAAYLYCVFSVSIQMKRCSIYCTTRLWTTEIPVEVFHALDKTL